MNRGQKQTGFTIVELLIVIVVIAILAAITLVSYNGIRDRAVAAAVQSAADQYSDKVQIYMATNGGQTPSEATFATDLQLPASTAKNTYDYFTNSAQTSFCFSVTDTTVNKSYARTEKGSLVEGRCVENLVTNPSLEVNSIGWSAYTGVAVPVRSTAFASAGSASLSATGNNTTSNPRVFMNIPAAPGDVMSIMFKVRSAGQAPNSASLVYKNALGVNEQSTFGSQDTPWSVDANGWSIGRGITTLPTGGDSLRLNFGVRLGTNYAATSVMYFDEIIVIKSSLPVPNYADGNSPNWSWVDAENNSASFGPMIF